MLAFWLTTSLLLGLIVGSFLNVLVLRWNTGRSVVRGRSQCFCCGRTLRWFDLVPLLSFARSLGRCRQCGARLSWQYPLVELGTGVLFTFAVWNVWPAASWLLFWWPALALLVAIAAYDWRHQIIPDAFVYPLIALSGAWMMFRGWPTVWPGLLTGLLAAAFFASLWLYSSGRWMGLGDAKLALALGWLSPPLVAITGFCFAFWLGALVGVGFILGARLWPRAPRFTMKSALPFAPFLILGALLAHFGRFDVFTFLQIF